MKGLTIGADPELFLQEIKSGKYVSAHELVPGTKAYPLQIPDGAVQHDGMAAEFNIEPVSTAEDFLKKIQSVTDTLTKIVTQQQEGLRLVAVPLVRFPLKYYRTIPADAKQLGCDPDFDAWRDGAMSPPPNGDTNIRTGGGHIHVGWTEHADVDAQAHLYDCVEFTKQLDTVLYTASLLWDVDRDRQRMYGKPGAFRPKPYGVEYRTLSNAWVANKELAEWIFHTVKEAFKLSFVEEYKLFWDKETRKLSPLGEFVLRAHKATRQELVDFHRDVCDYGFPELPQQFLEV